MPDIYDRARALAIKLLGPRDGVSGKGVVLTLVQTSTPEYEPGQPPPVPVESRYDGSGLRTQFDSDDIDNTLVLRNDVRFLLSPVMQNGGDMPEPKPGDAIEFLGTRYEVMNVTAWNYVGLQIGFVVQGRE